MILPDWNEFVQGFGVHKFSVHGINSPECTHYKLKQQNKQPKLFATSSETQYYSIFLIKLQEAENVVLIYQITSQSCIMHTCIISTSTTKCICRFICHQMKDVPIKVKQTNKSKKIMKLKFSLFNREISQNNNSNAT